MLRRLFTSLASFFRRQPAHVLWLMATAVAAVYLWVLYVFLVSPTGFRWRAVYGDPDYPKGYDIHGIDISHYQGDVDWDRLRNAMVESSPLRFVIVKSTEGDSHIDSRFRDNFANARDYGFIRGAYHFWSNKSPARRQAYFFLAMVKLQPGDLPPILDVESKPKEMSTEVFQQNVLTWLHIVEDRYNVKPIIYTYYNFKDKYLSDARFNDYPYWIAHYYVQRMEYPGPWKLWQHTDAGRLPGIRGYVDLDIFNGSFYNLRMLTIPEPKPVEADSTILRDSLADTTVVQAERP